MLRWPDAQAVDAAVRSWAARLAEERPEVRAVGYFGSYARSILSQSKDWDVGSDLDLVIIVAGSERPFTERAAAYDATSLPVPADLLVYTQAEWRSLDPAARFTRTLRTETVWVWGANYPSSVSHDSDSSSRKEGFRWRTRWSPGRR